ncbi:hypothetical protein [Streptomyces sp. TRM68367]|uniref:hypothetical protein n=1 Tax=Streptomyces sp. TRM68367 TaxID=2758415 RepID=UPI00165C3A5D|nr:hypothetical protein [Streptomyces sp. TRM68367]MBC9730233.1 hypothetical protein [Streptomyces sp. TRM68367]
MPGKHHPSTAGQRGAAAHSSIDETAPIGQAHAPVYESYARVVAAGAGVAL